MWSGGTKTGWITTTPHHTLVGCHILSTNNSSNKKTTIRSCPTLCSLLHVVVKKLLLSIQKNAHNARDKR
jgi:hypothetical protein